MVANPLSYTIAPLPAHSSIAWLRMAPRPRIGITLNLYMQLVNAPTEWKAQVNMGIGFLWIICVVHLLFMRIRQRYNQLKRYYYNLSEAVFLSIILIVLSWLCRITCKNDDRDIKDSL